MTISINGISLKKQLDAANPGPLADMLRAAQIGSALRAMPTFRRRLNFNAALVNPYVLATVQSIQLPDDAKAATIIRATAITGGGTQGELINDGYAAAAPAAGHISIQPNGDLAALIADAWTAVDVYYQPEKLDVVELTLPVVAASGLCALPVVLGQLLEQGVSLLMEAEVLVGGVLGKQIVQIPTDAAPATGHARLTLNKIALHFAVADAVTSCRVKLGVTPGPRTGGVDIDVLLTAASPFI